MKLDILSREIVDITVTDTEVVVSLQASISHGAVKKAITPITIEHAVFTAALLTTGDTHSGIDDAIVMAVAGANARADEAIAALRGLKSL